MDVFDGEKIKKLRLERKLSQYQLAVLLGMYPSQISRIECGKQKCSKVLALAVSAVLHVDLEFFIKNTSVTKFILNSQAVGHAS